MLSNRPLWRLLYFVFLRHWVETTAGPTECLHSKDTSTTPFWGCRSRRGRLVSLEKKFYVYKVYKQFGSRSGLTECQAYFVKPDQVPNCSLLSSPIVLVIVLLSISTRARANIQFTEEFKALHIQTKIQPKIFVFFFCFLLLLFFILSKLAGLGNLGNMRSKLSLKCATMLEIGRLANRGSYPTTASRFWAIEIWLLIYHFGPFPLIRLVFFRMHSDQGVRS